MPQISKKRGDNETPKAYRTRVANHIWPRVMALHRPEEMHRIQEEMRRRSRRLYSAFADRPDGLELADTLRDLLEDCSLQAHYRGFRRGWLVSRKRFRSESGTAKRVRAAIARLIEKHPEWTTSKIFEALDNIGELRVYRLKTVPKRVTCWADVAKDPSYKMFVSRIKERIRAKWRIAGWKNLMRKHEALRRGPRRKQET